MNKAQLIEEILKGSNGIGSKAEAERAINAVLAAVKSGLQKDNVVQLVGFGTFEVKTRKARKGRNPKTGQEIDIPKSKAVTFRRSKSLDAVV